MRGSLHDIPTVPDLIKTIVIGLKQVKPGLEMPTSEQECGTRNGGVLVTFLVSTASEAFSTIWLCRPLSIAQSARPFLQPRLPISSKYNQTLVAFDGSQSIEYLRVFDLCGGVHPANWRLQKESGSNIRVRPGTK